MSDKPAIYPATRIDPNAPTHIGGSDALRYAPDLCSWTPEQERIMNEAAMSLRNFINKHKVAPNHFLMSQDYFYTMATNPRANNHFGGLRMFSGLMVLICPEMKSEVVACLC